MTYGTLYNLYYNGELLYKCLTEEELGEVIQDYADISSIFCYQEKFVFRTKSRVSGSTDPGIRLET